MGNDKVKPSQFSSPEEYLRNLNAQLDSKKASELGKVFVCGTTGFSDEEKKQLEESFTKYKKQVGKEKVKSWLYSNLIITPIVVITTALTINFIK